MLQQVLAVRRAVFHLTDDTDQFGMQAVDTQVYCRTLTRLNNLVIELFLHLSHNFLDTGGMDTAIAHQLMKGQTAALTTHGIEARDNDGLGGVIHYDFHTCSGLKGTDITSLTTDDTAFHLIIIDMEHRN